jgi:D-3-phosphoglycerate dehydrogenase / 2-oxoglutarate reductase
MTEWKVLLTDGLEKEGQEILSKHAQVDNKKDITPEDLLKVIGDYDAIIVRGRTKLTPEVFAAAKKLKVAGRAGVGVDNINLPAAKEHGVVVVNSPLATTVSVAELTLGLMLSLIREIPRADAGMKQTNWLKKELKGTELYQKTLGVIGFGRIGVATAERAKAFGMKIIAYDPLIKPEEIKKRGGEPVTLDELLAKSDFITMHLPLTADSKNLLNKTAFDKMKPGVRIICAARGGVIEEAALLEALKSGKVAGAALDVFATEPPGKSELAEHLKVVCTPHIGAETVEAQARAALDISSEVVAALKGETLRWRVS